MYSFHATIHVRPADVRPGATVRVGAREIQTLEVAPTSLRVPCACSFEEAVESLSKLPRMYCEPDGSFVCASAAREAAWQVDGNLYDRDERLLFVDIKGTCTAARFDELLDAFGWPATTFIFQLVREAIFVDEAEFRRLAGGV